MNTVSKSSTLPGITDNRADWFYPEWAANAPHNTPIHVLDTDSALGRYNLQSKEIGLKDLARIHGHLCDGLVIAFVLLRAAFERLFPEGVVDRTDLRVVSKNSPCMVDTAAMISGARINFQTLRVDATLDNAFVVQRISTGEACWTALKDGVFPQPAADLAGEIRRDRAEGKPVKAGQIDRIEALHDELSLKLLATPAEQLLEVVPLPGYQFHFNDLYTGRGDVINKTMPRVQQADKSSR